MGRFWGAEGRSKKGPCVSIIHPVFQKQAGRTSLNTKTINRESAGKKGMLSLLILLGECLIAWAVIGGGAPGSARAGGCPSPGSLGIIMLDCPPSTISPPPRGAQEESSSAYFDRSWTLRIRVPQGDWHSAVRSSVADWVGKRLFPHPTTEEKALLNEEIRNLTRTGFPVKAVKESDLIARVRVSPETLNLIADRLKGAVRKGHLSNHLDKVVVTGGGKKENKFAAAQIPVPEDGIVAADLMSRKLYDLSQVPGFSRVDGMMVPAIATRNINFSLPHILTIHTGQKDWARDIRRQIVLLLANLLLDMKNPLSQKIVKDLSERLSRIPWPLMTIQKEANDAYHVEVSPRLLNTLKNILLQSAAVGEVSQNLYGYDAKGQLSTGSLFAPGQALPEFDDFLVHIVPTSTFSGSQIEVDNYGYAATGAIVLNATGNVNNALVAGGLFSVNAATTLGGMNSGVISYSMPFGLYVRTGVDFSAMDYTLGKGISPWGNGANTASLAALGVSGNNYSGDLWTSQALLQSDKSRLVLKETLFMKGFHDIYSQTVQNDRNLVGGILDLSGSRTLESLSLFFDLSDTEYDLSQTSASSSLNPFYSDTPGFQNYLVLNAQVTYSLTPTYSFSVATVDQKYIGGGTLDPMLQATLGGVSNVMALPTAALFGNDIYAGMLSFTRIDRVDIGAFSSSALFDAGEIMGIGSQYSAMGPGVEEIFSTNHFFAKIDAAFPIGALPVGGLGNSITALSGGNIAQGGIPIQLWFSVGLRD